MNNALSIVIPTPTDCRAAVADIDESDPQGIENGYSTSVREHLVRTERLA